MNLYTCDRAAAGVVLMLLMLCGVGVEGAFAQRRAGNGAQDSVSARQSQPPPIEDDGPVSRHVDEGLRYADEGNWAEAIKAYREALALNPRHGDALIFLGDAYMNLGKYEEAFVAYKEAIRVAPSNADAHYSLGAAYRDMAMYGDSFRHFVQAIRLDPSHVEAHYGIGYSYLKLDNYRQALGYLRRAIRLRPDFAEAHLALGLTHLGQGRTKAAEEELKVLQGMDELLARELEKEMQRIAVVVRPAEQRKPAGRRTPDRAARDSTLREPPSTREPGGEAPPQKAPESQTVRPQRAGADPARLPQRPALSASARARSAEAAARLNVELKYWDTIKGSSNPEEFDSYLKKYPAGQFAELARIRMRALEAKRDETGTAGGEQKTEEAVAEPPKTPEEQPTPTTVAEPAAPQPVPPRIEPTVPPRPESVFQSRVEPESASPLGEVLKSLRKDFPTRFKYQVTTPGEDANAAAFTSEVVIDYEPLQFDGCRLEWRAGKDILSVALSDFDALSVKVEERSKPNATFSIAVWNLTVVTAGGKPAIREFKGDGSGAVNTYNGLNLQFDNKEKAEGLALLLQQAIRLCVSGQKNP